MSFLQQKVSSTRSTGNSLVLCVALDDRVAQWLVTVTAEFEVAGSNAATAKYLYDKFEFCSRVDVICMLYICISVCISICKYVSVILYPP